MVWYMEKLPLTAGPVAAAAAAAAKEAGGAEAAAAGELLGPPFMVALRCASTQTCIDRVVWALFGSESLGAAGPSGPTAIASTMIFAAEPSRSGGGGGGSGSGGVGGGTHFVLRHVETGRYVTIAPPKRAGPIGGDALPEGREETLVQRRRRRRGAVRRRRCCSSSRRCGSSRATRTRWPSTRHSWGSSGPRSAAAWSESTDSRRGASEAERCGRIHTGDEIVAVNGVRLSESAGAGGGGSDGGGGGGGGDDDGSSSKDGKTAPMSRESVLKLIQRGRPVTIEFRIAQPTYYRVIGAGGVSNGGAIRVLHKADLASSPVFDRCKQPGEVVEAVHVLVRGGVTFFKLAHEAGYLADRTHAGRMTGGALIRIDGPERRRRPSARARRPRRRRRRHWSSR